MEPRDDAEAGDARPTAILASATSEVAPPEAPKAGSRRLISGQMLAIIAIAFFTYLGFGMVTVTLPHYVKDSLGGGDLTVGVVVGIYSFSAVLARPSAGRYGNRFGRRTLMIGGAGAIGLSFALYGAAPNVPALMVLRLVTGFAEGMFYVGSATLVTDLVPAHRRAEAVGYYSVALYLGAGIGPSIGVALSHTMGPASIFVVAGAISGFGALLSIPLDNPRYPDEPGERMPFVNRKAVLPGIVLALGVLGLVPFQAYVPLYADQLHMDGSQYVFLLYSAVVVTMRAAGAPIHRIDPRRTSAAAQGFIVVGLGTIALWGAPAGLYLGAALFAMGISVQFPALMAIALSGASDRERSSVVGTFTGFMDLAIGTGGFVLGIPAALAGYQASFAAAAGFALVGMVVLRLKGGPRR